MSFALGGATLVGDPVIDSGARTVTATVEPVDLSKVTPSVTVSTGATYTAANLSDGEAVVYTVVAENGTSVEWKVTVTVTPGVFFTYGSTDVVLIKGFVHSTDATANETYGNGVPFGSYYSTQTPPYTLYFALEEEYDYGTATGGPTKAYSRFLVAGKTTGDMANSLIQFTYTSGSSSSPVISISMTYENTVTFNISEYGAVGEYIKGTFSCSDASYSENNVAGDNVKITSGFFKVKRVADNLSS